MAEVTAKKRLGLVKYFKDVRSEMNKVVWPSFSKLRNNTLIVIVYMIIIAIIIAILDTCFGLLVRYVTSSDFSWAASAAFDTAKTLL